MRQKKNLSINQTECVWILGPAVWQRANRRGEATLGKYWLCLSSWPVRTMLAAPPHGSWRKSSQRDTTETLLANWEKSTVSFQTLPVFHLCLSALGSSHILVYPDLTGILLVVESNENTFLLERHIKVELKILHWEVACLVYCWLLMCTIY